MSDGLPVPWPFPWSHMFPPSSTAFSQFMAASIDGVQPSSAEPPNAMDTVKAKADSLCSKFGDSLPPVRSAEVYLVEGVAQVNFPESAKPSSGSAVTTSKLAVIYPPEFLFVLDVGLDCLVGGSVIWSPVGYGDPGFPEKNEFALRSIRKRTQSDLIFPNIAGSLMIGLKDGTQDDDVKKSLSDYGLQDVMFFGTFVTANCKPFQEPTICRELEATLPFLKYAEQNNLRRIIDFAPGWVAKRLA